MPVNIVGGHNEDERPEMVVMPYQDPLERALGTLGKQAAIAFATAFLIGAADLVAQMLTGAPLDPRAAILAILALVLHAALTALHKYSTSS